MFKTIEEFPNYEITRDGVVRNKETKREIKWNINKGYAIVRLQKDKKQMARQVHRLVLITYNPIPGMDKLCVNHRDENKLNNSIDNLEWCTMSYNNNYGTRVERTRKKLMKPIACYDAAGRLVAQYEGVRAAATELGYNASSISRAANRENKFYMGYWWEYIKKEGK